jgi:hypothetical protein
MKINCLKRTGLAMVGIIASFQCISAPAASPPSIDFGPKSQTVYAGAGVSFQVLASGDALNYVWLKDGIALADGGRISGANKDTLNIAKTDASDRGVYSCIISNTAGVAASINLANATLMVDPLPSGLLYAETFPSPWCHTNQDYPLNTVGWNPGGKRRIHNNTAGTCNPWIWESDPGTFVYYATTASDTGVSGLPFPSIMLASNPDLSLAAEIGAGTNVTVCFAVQINGSRWFVSTTQLAIQNRDPYGLASCTQAFRPAATNWQTLTIDGETGMVGGPAAADLTGSITGAGLVFLFTAEDSGSFGNFKISSASKN